MPIENEQDAVLFLQGVFCDQKKILHKWKKKLF